MTYEEEFIAELQKTVERQSAELATCGTIDKNLREELRMSQQRHYKDIERIGEALIAEADRRGWCHEYDQFVEALNVALYHDLPLRTREYVVSHVIELTREITVQAASYEDAVTFAEEDEDYDIEDGLENGKWTLTHRHDSLTAEEAD